MVGGLLHGCYKFGPGGDISDARISYTSELDEVQLSTSISNPPGFVPAGKIAHGDCN